VRASGDWWCARYLAGGVGVAAVAAAGIWVTPAPSLALAAPGTAAAQAGRAVTATGPAAGPAVAVSGGALADSGSGALLWSRDLGVRRPMGSITKVMTALVVLRAGHLGQEIRVTPAAVAYVRQNDGSSAGLVAGDVLTARQLLEALLLPSGCDAAYLLATAYGPGRGAFIARMNATAASLHMTSTHFAGFDGLPIPTEYSTYSTPADLLRLGEQVMRRPVFAQIVAQRSYDLPAGAGHHRYVWWQTNNLIGSYPGAVGIKTGYTRAAGTCLLFEARRGRVTLIGVVLHASAADTLAAVAAAAARLLDWGFART
jgi:serine-type D-Ala-D-Ala carboxypeptidase (penicillin-binding protein 5/6)